MKEDARGAVFIEATIVLPFTAILMLLFVYMINIFVVQSIVQYSLNQTVNELGNYTYYLDYLGIIKMSNDSNKALITSGDSREKNKKELTEGLSSFHKILDGNNSDIGDDGAASNVSMNDILNSLDSAKNFADIAMAYKQKPMSLFTDVLCPYLVSAKDSVHTLIGSALGKVMMYRYADNTLLSGCGVVDVNYNGLSESYYTGIDGMDFSNSSFLKSTDSRVIDIVVVYRIKFPFNMAKVFNIKDGALYDNSLCVVQRATGYGWINGDGSGGKYNGKGIWS